MTLWMIRRPDCSRMKDQTLASRILNLCKRRWGGSPSDAQGLQADLDALTEWQDLHISNDMRWDAHIAHATGKANRTLGVIRRNLSHCTSQVKNTCYKALVRPQLEYCASVWDPYTAGGVQAVERVQRRAARMVMNDYGRTSSVTEMLQKTPMAHSRQQKKRGTVEQFTRPGRTGTICGGLSGLPTVKSTHLPPPQRYPSRGC
ncbi:hypothetical protein Bbelb_152680 [Branchiostoma belcheri]|nr:hypothetical protein Bbelb_152680 [Branchiostoma belcheri]